MCGAPERDGHQALATAVPGVWVPQTAAAYPHMQLSLGHVEAHLPRFWLSGAKAAADLSGPACWHPGLLACGCSGSGPPSATEQTQVSGHRPASGSLHIGGHVYLSHVGIYGQV